MATDLIVAAAGTKFQIREACSGHRRSPTLGHGLVLGRGRFATEIALTGRYFSAEEAYQFGIVNRVVPQEQVLAEGAAGSGYHAESAVVRAGQCAGVALVRATYGRGGALLSGRLKLHLTEDFRESAQAFMEKRPPEFKGQVEPQPRGGDVPRRPPRHGLGGWACPCATCVS